MNAVAKRLLTVVGAAILLVYVGYQVFAVSYASVSYETVVSHTVYDILDISGIAVRNEQVLSGEESGYLYYTLKNGDRVSSGGTIAEVYPSEQSASLYEQIQRIDRQIATLQALQRQETASKTNLDAVHAQIRDQQRLISRTASRGKMENLRNVRDSLLELMNRKQITVGKAIDFTGRLAELSETRAALYAQYTPVQRTVQSPVAGYFVSRVDGYENLLSYSNVSALTVDAIRTALETVPTVSEGAYVGKVVGDYEWYLACIVPTEKLSLISVGSDLEIKLPFVSGDVIPVTVKSVQKSGNEAAVILQCGYMSEELSSARCERVQLLLREYTGLYVPNEALRFNDKKEAGVYVRVGNLLRFRRVEVLYYSENGKYAICKDREQWAKEEAQEVPQDSLKLYDDMVVEGKNLYDGKMVR